MECKEVLHATIDVNKEPLFLRVYQQKPQAHAVQHDKPFGLNVCKIITDCAKHLIW